MVGRPLVAVALGSRTHRSLYDRRVCLCAQHQCVPRTLFDDMLCTRRIDGMMLGVDQTNALLNDISMGYETLKFICVLCSVYIHQFCEAN